NFIDLIPISQEWAGPEKDMHLKAPPLFYVPTDSNTPFRFSYHVHDFGNMIVIGPPGGGKNVLAHFIAVSFLKYKDAQIFYFDKDYSGYVATKIAGGVHYDISEKSTAFQPLREIDDPGEMGWARDWLIDLLENENVKITSDIKSDLWSALESLSRDKNKDNRTITGFNVLVQNKEIQKTLEAYTIGNTYGLLDAKRNDIAKANWLTFEMNKLISDMKGAILPTLSFIFHEIEKRLKDYRPTMVFLNEAWLFFETPLFTKRIRDWLKTFRTRNAAIVLITQSLADTSGESFKVLMQTIQESIPSRIFIPNINVKKPEVAKLYEAYGLNENQINIIGNALPKKDYYLNSDIGNRKFNLNLGDIAKAVCASTSMEDYKLLKSFEDKGGDYAKAFLKCKLADIRRST
ncbi:MAG: conjugal transfer protein TrbE, partial [Lentisphaerae bacterium]|nr:conjugal transfer protein TrbE [Lentisphaerota bacterium]